MKNRKGILKAIPLLLCMLALMLPRTVHAVTEIKVPYDPTRNVTMTVDIGHQVEGVTVELYKVYRLEPDGTMVLTDRFEHMADFVNDLPEEFDISKLPYEQQDWDDLTETLYPIVRTEDFAPDTEKETDAQGIAAFTDHDVSKGIYLVLTQTPNYAMNRFMTSPAMVALPEVNPEYDPESPDPAKREPWIYDVQVKPKATDCVKDPLKVVKVWNDNEDSEKKRPVEIEVELYREKELYDTVKLNKENNWTYEWEDIPLDANYDIVEAKVPDGYKVSYSEKGNIIASTWTITNTCHIPPDRTTPPGSKTPPPTSTQTNPVLWLCAGGLALMLIGMLIISRKRKNN